MSTTADDTLSLLDQRANQAQASEPQAPDTLALLDQRASGKNLPTVRAPAAPPGGRLTARQNLELAAGNALHLGATLATAPMHPAKAGEALANIVTQGAAAIPQGLTDLYNLAMGHGVNSPDRVTVSPPTFGQAGEQLSGLNEGVSGLAGAGVRAGMTAAGVSQPTQEAVMEYGPEVLNAAGALSPALRYAPAVARGVGRAAQGAAGLAGRGARAAGGALERMLPPEEGGPRGRIEPTWEIEEPVPPPPGNGMQSRQAIGAAPVGRGANPEGPQPLGQPVRGGLPEEYHEERAGVLQRVGLENARESAIRGDAQAAATDFQLTKYDEPAGEAAGRQFEHERQTLANHAENIIRDQGGSIGMDESDLTNRGRTIARPFDMLRIWLEAQRRGLYAEANSRAATSPPITLEGVDEMLNDRTFRNQLGAKEWGQGFLHSVQDQLAHFRETNPDGMNVAIAEHYRQFLNSIWTPQNSRFIGRLKGAIDDEVVEKAGDDLYRRSRAMAILEHRALNDPQGIASLFDHDPQTPINRSTALEDIPNKLVNLSGEQFAHVLDVLRQMPEALQPEAQAAMGEIRGHLVNRLLEAGIRTGQGRDSQLWGADRVSRLLRGDAEKYRIAFRGQTQAMEQIEDLNAAGQILKVDPSYPGASAQAANALRRGMLSRALQHIAGSVGAGVGGSIAGGLGAAAGAALGEQAGARMGAAASERRALRQFQRGTRNLGPPGTGNR